MEEHVSYNVYECSYWVQMGCGCCYDDIENVVVAESKEEALDFIMERYDHTNRDEWSVYLIATTAKKGIHDGE